MSRFFKLTNKKENHFGFQFKTGLNIDTNTFNPKCGEKGGFHFFSEEQLLSFNRHYVEGKYIREVYFTGLDDVLISNVYGMYKANKFILGERKKFTDNPQDFIDFWDPDRACHEQTERDRTNKRDRMTKRERKYIYHAKKTGRRRNRKIMKSQINTSMDIDGDYFVLSKNWGTKHYLAAQKWKK